jgi:(p)ppGpp synthase/HD superfamily hydrolase
MELTERQERLFEFVKEQHGSQVRKYVGTPYWNHLWSVAELASTYVKHPLVKEIALCHDVIEDTKCTIDDLFTRLGECQYDRMEAIDICGGVMDLTDQFTKEKFPTLNRAQRKQKEAERLGSISKLSQSIKYADLIDNTSTIVQYDHGFAKVYLSEKRVILNEMRSGNIDLYILVCATLYNAENELITSS